MEQFTILPLSCSLALVIISLSLLTIDRLVPQGYQIFGESLCATILNLTQKSIFYPLLLSVFTLLFLSNYLGLIPYSITASTE